MSCLAGVAETDGGPAGIDRGVKLTRLWLAMALIAMAAGAHAQLSGGDRASFIARVRASCERGIARQPGLARVSRRGFAAVCACTARKVADSTDSSQLMVRRSLRVAGSPVRPDELPASLQELIQDSVSECLEERGGYIPGETITPNH